MKQIFFTFGLFLLISLLFCVNILYSQNTLREHGIKTGIFNTGKYNAITDVPGVSVGQVTCIQGEDIRTGVTAIIPHQGNIFRKKVPAAIYIGNGFGKLAGYSQVKELGNIETPIILTNTLNVAAAIDGLITYTLQQPGNSNIESVNAVVGETNDGALNNIQARYITPDKVLQAIAAAKTGTVEQGSVGAGTGTVCFGFKGGIGTSSRVLPKSLGGYTVGVLVQSNYGGVLEIAGIQVGQLLKKYSFKQNVMQDVDGSCMMVVITDAPVDARNLERIAKRAIMGLAKTGGIASNGSGDYVIAMSVCPGNLINESESFYSPKLLNNDSMSPFWNSLFMATTIKGVNGRVVEPIPVETVLKLIR